jgi:hypothetical protein
VTSVRTYVAAGVLGALVAFAALVAVSMVINDGRFEYALDDVYIHLAMAEQLYAGGYGVNAGEFASAASSPLYPVLLPTWFGIDAQAWLPFLWNIVAISVTGGIVGWALERAELPRFGLWLAVLAPFAMTMPVVAFTGMENMAHGAASLAIVFGLWRFIETGRIGPWLVLGIFLAPAFRLEGLALALAAAGVVTVQGRLGAGLGLGFLALLPAIAFVGTLTALGLDPLPNSVNAKLPDPSAAEAGLIAGVVTTFRENIATPGGIYVLALTIVVWLMSMIALQRGARGQGLVALAVVASAAAHLAVASTGWMDRYENYLVLALFAVLALLLADTGRVAKTAILSAALVGGVLTYAPNLDNFVHNPRAISLQQAQMARFAKEHLRAPVAVNDLGYVAWNNPNYVLDLWGLASAEALATRLSNPSEGWADPLAEAHGVRVAMIYDRWLPEALGADWVPLGQLVLWDAGGPFLGGLVVSFYARSAADARDLEGAIEAWSEGLPEGAEFIAAKPEGTS